MRRIVSLILMLMPLQGFAQIQSLEFYYIAHDRPTPVNDLCERLEYTYNNSLDDESVAVIFYLPNGDKPLVVKVNLPGDNRGDFEKIISELRVEMSHEIYVYKDIEVITDLFNTYDIVTDNGEQIFSSVLFSWYVNEEFWMLDYNKSLFANLYFILELEKYRKDGYVSIEFWHAKDDGLESRINQQDPFGPKGLCGDLRLQLFNY